MKLLFCPKCQDIFRLPSNLIERVCECGKTRGRYLDELNAEYSGGIPLGFENSSLVAAIMNQPNEGMGKQFTAFVIPKLCDTFEELS